MADPVASAAAVMQAALPSSVLTQWGKGEIISLVFAVSFVIVGGIWNRKMLSRDRVYSLAGNGLTLGPLAMIVADPVNKGLSLFNVDLLQTAMMESRVTLWWAAFSAGLSVILSLQPPSSPSQSHAPVQARVFLSRNRG